METQFQRSYSDYLEIVAAQRVRSSRPRRIAFNIAFLLILLFGIFILVSLRLTLAQATVAMLGGSFILARIAGAVSTARLNRWLKRDFALNPGFARKSNARVDDGGLYLEGEDGNSYTKWLAFVKYQETPNLFLLYVGTRSLHAIPKRAFSPEQLEEFRRIIRIRIPTNGPSSEERSMHVESLS